MRPKKTGATLRQTEKLKPSFKYQKEQGKLRGPVSSRTIGRPWSQKKNGNDRVNSAKNEFKVLNNAQDCMDAKFTSGSGIAAKAISKEKNLEADFQARAIQSDKGSLNT